MKKLIVVVVLATVCICALELRETNRKANRKVNFDLLQSATVVITDGFGFGSGAIVTEDGLILTAGHVVDMSPSKVILADGNEYEIVAQWRSINYDVGFVKIDANDLPVLPFANVLPNVGDIVYLCGSPYDMELFSTVTMGIVSFVDREWWEYPDGTIQTDAEGAGGSSGGPLVNSDGMIVGICVAGPNNGGGVTICEGLEHIKRALKQFSDYLIEKENES